MGYFGYEFIDRTPTHVAERRIVLDWYATLAQLSQFLVLLGIPTCSFLGSLLIRFLDGDLANRPFGSASKGRYRHLNQTAGTSGVAARTARIILWRLDSPVIRGYGTWGQWIGGSLWTAWLAFLCFNETVPDYMHLTKRFGLVAASQLPLHYLLAMKSTYSPMQLLLKKSHESLIHWHQVNGRIITTFFVLHATFYVNFFARKGIIGKKLQESDALLGLISISIFLTIGTTAMGFMRKRNYNLFYRVHVIGSTVVLPLLFFHVHHVRIYVLEAGVVLATNVFLRSFYSNRLRAEVRTVPGSSLVKITTKWPGYLEGWLPGEHVYFREDRANILNKYLSKNPFTIASLPSAEGGGRDLVLVARRMNANTKKLYATASIAELNIERGVPVSISLEGPYGHSRYLPDPLKFTRVLFIAGGVGATFIVPVWKHFYQSHTPHQELRLIWAVRSASDSEWALDTFHEHPRDTQLYEIDVRELHVTGIAGSVSKNALDDDQDPQEEAIELLTQHRDSESGDPAKAAEDAGFSVKTGQRPDLRMSVDVTVSGNTGQSAVIVCGPRGMIDTVRRQVGGWVERGEDVYWHAEEFGL